MFVFVSCFSYVCVCLFVRFCCSSFLSVWCCACDFMGGVCVVVCLLCCFLFVFVLFIVFVELIS